MDMPIKPTVKSGNEVEATAGSEGSRIVLETLGIHRQGLPRTNGKLQNQKLE